MPTPKNLVSERAKLVDERGERGIGHEYSSYSPVSDGEERPAKIFCARSDEQRNTGANVAREFDSGNFFMKDMY